MPKNKSEKKIDNNNNKGIKITSLEDEVKFSYIDYAMSVIVSRALPDVRDGLKPVHRRILYSMHIMGLKHNTRYRKSATVVGNTLGKFHPHGDQAVYDSMVRMAQDFSLRYPLIDGQGNWGSGEDKAAQMRYCLSGDSLIVTNRCLERIEDISTKEDIDIKVLSFNNKVNRASKWFNSGIHPTLKIKTFRGLNLCGSLNHPILTWQSNNKDNPKFKWKLLKDIKKEDYAAIVRSDNLWSKKEPSLKKFYQTQANPRTKIHTLPDRMTPELAFILGAIVAEGHTTRQHRSPKTHKLYNSHIGFCNSDREFIRTFKSNFKKVFPDCRLHEFKRRPQGYTKNSYVSLEIHSKHVVNFLENLGLKHCRARGKVVPPILFHATKVSTAAFIRAYAEGDGSIFCRVKGSKRLNSPTIALVSTSSQLLKELQIFLLRFGIASFLRFDRIKDYYLLFIRGHDNLNLFKNNINFVTKKKINKLLELAQINSNNKVMSRTDYIPFLSEYIRNKYCGNKDIIYKKRVWLKKHNINRLPKIKNYWKILKKILDDKDQKLFKDLIDNNYLFDKIISISKGGYQRVYSLKVESDCHSFISNGFISHNTECRLSSAAEEMLLDIDQETVNFVPNYDNTLKEPRVLPSKLPNLIINGSMGIAVGMATKIPPHNLSEVCDALIYLIGHPKAGIDDLFNFIHGPDFPTGGIIFDINQIKQVYAIGKGPIAVRSKTEIIEKSRDQFQIIVSELPYSVNKANLLIKVAELVKNKRIEGIRDVRDESDKQGIRIVFELKKGTFPQKILNSLFKLTDLQQVFNVNILALLDGIQPKTFSLKGLLEEYISHRQSVVYRRTDYNLIKTKERIHILKGLVIAIDHIDAIIKLIKNSSDREKAKINLIKKYNLSEIQAQAILETRLHQLANLETQKIKIELKEKIRIAKELKKVLSDPRLILKIIKDEIKELKKKYGDERRTKVVSQGIQEFKQEDLIPNEPAIIILTRDGYIKRLPPESFKTQARGGKGVAGMEIKEEDRVHHLITATTHDNLLFFTTNGRVFQLKAYEIPQSKRTARGQSLVNFLEILSDEKVSVILPVSELKKYRYLIMVTKNGVIKKVPIDAFENVRRSGLIALKLRQNDTLEWVKPTTGNDEVILVSAGGQAIRFREKDLRPMTRIASGVRGIRLRTNDRVVGMDIIPSLEKGKYKILIITENGFGKITLTKNYRFQKRGGVGIKTAKINEKTGKIVGSIVMADVSADLLLISRLGQIIRVPLKSVPEMNRSTQGVKLMRFKQEHDKVSSFNIILN